MQFAPTHLRNWLDFLLAMTEKEIKARYKHAFLGFLWVILNPLLQMVVIGFLFQFFVPVRVENYFLFLFAGLLPWNFFSQSVAKTTPSIVYERSLIQKAKFPREAIVLSIVLSNLFHFFISLSLFLVVLFGFGLVTNSLSTMSLGSFLTNGSLLILTIGWLTLLTTSLSLLFAALNVRFRDVNFLVQAGMPLWFYATPVVYTLNLLPSYLHKFLYLNPMTAIIELFQFVLVGKPIELSWYWWLSLISTAVIVGLGIKIFSKESPFFDDWI